METTHLHLSFNTTQTNEHPAQPSPAQLSSQLSSAQLRQTRTDRQAGEGIHPSEWAKEEEHSQLYLLSSFQWNLFHSFILFFSFSLFLSPQMSSDKLDMSLGDIITSGRKNPKRGAASNKKTPANRASPASNKKKTIAKGNAAKKTSTSNKKSNNNSKGAASPASKGKAANSNKKRQQVRGRIAMASAHNQQITW